MTKEERNAYMRDYYKKNKEKIYAANKRWIAKAKEQRRIGKQIQEQSASQLVQEPQITQ